jgi:hypothetical protein
VLRHKRVCGLQNSTCAIKHPTKTYNTAIRSQYMTIPQCNTGCCAVNQ